MLRTTDIFIARSPRRDRRRRAELRIIFPTALVGGLALLAYAAVYGASGIMTFIVNQDRVVWQRDVGKNTALAVAAIKQFNPDDGWTPLAPEG